jgi:hypothetical protein
MRPLLRASFASRKSAHVWMRPKLIITHEKLAAVIKLAFAEEFRDISRVTAPASRRK